MKNNFASVFHHFHDGKKHLKTQGSIDAEQFEKIILYLSQNYNLLSADLWIEKARKNNLNKDDICMTFDDALKCQYDIALPVLKKYNLKAIWAIYTSIFTNCDNYLEIFRYFRCTQYKDIDDFYSDFFNSLSTKLENYDEHIKSFESKEYLKEFTFYSLNDRLFRYMRDIVLTEEEYNEINLMLINKKKFDYKKIKHLLWMSKEDIKNLDQENHLIALHSHTHIPTIHTLNTAKQCNEYSQNQKILHSIIGENPSIITYPFGRYNTDTPHIMKELCVDIGFCSNMEIPYKDNLFFPRMDHAYLLKKI